MPAPSRHHGTGGGASAPTPASGASAPAPARGGGDAAGGPTAPASVDDKKLKVVTFNVGVISRTEFDRETWSDVCQLDGHDIIFLQEIGAWPGLPKDCCFLRPRVRQCKRNDNNLTRRLWTKLLSQ